MSFLSDTVLSGTARLHGGRGAAGDKDGVKGTSQSPAGLLAPLIQLVKDPYGTIVSGGKSSYGPEEGPLADVEADRKQVLYLRMRNAELYEDWEAAATELDTLEGNDIWKAEDESPEYNAALVKARIEQLDDARLNCDVKRMLFLVRTSLTRGLGGMGDLRLYKHSYIGTKTLIDKYIESAVKTLEALQEVSSKLGLRCPIDQRDIMEQVLNARQSFGRTALLLSGGGTFGMNHIGVVKSLWEQRLLPRIISGASAGSIVCAVLCSKTDAEMPQVLYDFCYGDMDVFQKAGEDDGLITKATRFLKHGSLFDISHLTRVMRSMLGDITFQESYNRTRRILNITVSSAGMHELPKLLNYVTAPDVMIWSAVCASCSVPFVFSTATLMVKDKKTGKDVPWDPTPNAGWIDGSVDNDLPMTRLAELFNVNHFIVSQVNPHVVPFLNKEEDTIRAEAGQNPEISAGPGWMHHMASFAKGEALHRLDLLAEMGVFPNAMTKARSIIDQKYSGDITIFPSISYANVPKILSNPSTEYMLRCLLTGEQATWPKLSRIQNHVAIELALDETVQQLRARVAFSPSQIDLRLNNFSRPLSQGDDNAGTDRLRALYKSAGFGNGTAPATPSVGMTSPEIARRARLRVRLPPQPTFVTKPYLPSHRTRAGTRSVDFHNPYPSHFDTVSSSTAPGGSSSEGDFSSNDESDTTDILSSPSPSHSPSTQQPTLWPSTRQILFPSTSQPTTPSLVAAALGHHRNSSSMNLTMTPSAAPSSPELRYKRLFHPPTSTSISETQPASSDTKHNIRKAIQPLAPMSRLEHTESLFEFQKVPPPSLHQTDSLPDVQVHTSPPLPSASSPHVRRHRKQDSDARVDSRRGSAQGVGLGLQLDISGTRGMMLRKKASKESGSFGSYG